MGIEIGGLFGLIILIADIWAIINVVQSSASTGSKVIWVLVILILPLVGFLAWLLFGPRGNKSARL
ncbi:MAG: PLDc N-terminal domain-containing protein [Tistlia sp.]|uniref:PLDc N-terminal domain-containing protein n=1 Tax=Tistlia sp. TaxID=3057121 RepID=UPI0034A1A90A